jgi:succinate dehydrogenase/fumarate reductase flavoprotein subunit
MPNGQRSRKCDVLVIRSGAGDLSAAIVARKAASTSL